MRRRRNCDRRYGSPRARRARCLWPWPGDRSCCPSDSCWQLDAEHQRAALAHEVAHVIRRDPAWRILAGAIERAFFFQPLNRVARAKLCESAEFLCDQWAVQQTRSPLALARCLSIVASWASPASDGLAAGASTMARSDSPLVRRVTRILNEPPRCRAAPGDRLAGASTRRRRDGRAARNRRATVGPGGCGSDLRDPGRGEHPS